MIPAGYMLKRVTPRPDWIKAANVVDIWSVSGCVAKEFAPYIDFWKHNGYWFFDTPEIPLALAAEHGIDIAATRMFYYEVFEQQFDDAANVWVGFAPEKSFGTNVSGPAEKTLAGFDVVTFSVQTSPECSPLSCNNLAETIAVNEHCLLATFDEAKTKIEAGDFTDSEPGPFRIFAVYTVPAAD